MKLIIVFAAVILAANALTQKEHWEQFKVKYVKSYKNPIEESIRYSIFSNNLKKIEQHNAKYEAGEETYTLGVNKFADMTEQEFKERLRIQRQNMPKIQGERHVFPDDLQVADSVDWRQKGAVVSVKDQGNCGSCWAFSTTGALEGQNFILNKKTVSLSEQELLDCSGSYGNGDCDEGGLMTDGFAYVRDNGIESETDYPYEAEQRSCRARHSNKVLKIKTYKEIKPTEEDLQKAVGSVGPISVAIYAEPIQLYHAGIFSDKACINAENKLDHGVLTVGYGEENNKPFWIVKNSWGSDWGENGYFRLARNANNLCGISSMASYPVL